MIRSLILLGFVASVTPLFGIGERDLWVEDLKVKFDPMNGFIDKPLTIKEAEKQDYMQVENPNTNSGFAGLTHWIKRGEWCYLVSLYYDEKGLIAGMQINQPIDKITSHYDLKELGFKIWNHLDVDYVYAPIFWVSEDKQTRIDSSNATKVLRNEFLTVPGFNGTMDKIATDCRKLDSVWVEEACIIMMGRHYYYKMTPSLTCDKPFYLWFPLCDDHTHQLIGVGHMYIGKSECKMEVPSTAAVKMIVPTAPQCLYDMVDKYGASTLHTYFVDRPRLIGC